MDNDEAYDMGYTDGHQDGERDAWLIATPIIHELRAELRTASDMNDIYENRLQEKEAESEKLRAALREIKHIPAQKMGSSSYAMAAIARAALEGK